jgi:hypothetical protein
MFSKKEIQVFLLANGNEDFFEKHAYIKHLDNCGGSMHFCTDEYTYRITALVMGYQYNDFLKKLNTISPENNDNYPKLIICFNMDQIQIGRCAAKLPSTMFINFDTSGHTDIRTDDDLKACIVDYPKCFNERNKTPLGLVQKKIPLLYSALEGPDRSSPILPKELASYIALLYYRVAYLKTLTFFGTKTPPPKESFFDILSMLSVNAIEDLQSAANNAFAEAQKEITDFSDYVASKFN